MVAAAVERQAIQTHRYLVSYALVPDNAGAEWVTKFVYRELHDALHVCALLTQSCLGSAAAHGMPGKGDVVLCNFPELNYKPTGRLFADSPLCEVIGRCSDNRRNHERRNKGHSYGCSGLRDHGDTCLIVVHYQCAGGNE